MLTSFKVTGTIASVRRTRQYLEEGIIEPSNNGVPPVNGSYGRGTRSAIVSAGRSQSVDAEPSFIAETSFVRAPLNSRVVSGSTGPRNRHKGKGRARDSLDGVPVEIQEALILEDLLFVLMVRGDNTSNFYANINMSRRE